LGQVEWRLAGDVEFYQAVYDAMAIEPLEALSGGAMCVLSSACGSVGLLDRVADSRQRGRVIVADYADLCRPAATFSLEEIIGIGQPQRDEVEGRIARQTAERLYAELVTSSQDWAVRLGQGREIAAALDADGVCRDCFLPALDRAYSSFRTRQIA